MNMITGKRLFLVFGLSFIAFSVYAMGAVDNAAVFAARHADDAVRVLKTVPDAVKPILSHGDDIIKAGLVHADDLARLTIKHADDVARLGLRQGDDLIHNFSAVHTRTRGPYTRIPRKNGRWNGVSGNSTFFPDTNHVPRAGKQVSDGMYDIPKTWKEIGENNLRQIREIDIPEMPLARRLELAENYKKFSSGEIGFNFKQGELDLSSFSYDTVSTKAAGYDQIPGWRYIRDDPLKQGRPGAMDVGDMALARKWNWTPEEVSAFRQRYGLTWNERIDLQTLDLVTVDMHLITHRGGHAVVNSLTGP